MQGENRAVVKALVWFWWIDETLSANLVYQSDYEIGSTILSDGVMVKIMMIVVTMMIKCLDLEKKKEKNKKLKAKVKLDRSFFRFGDRDT